MPTRLVEIPATNYVLRNMRYELRITKCAVEVTVADYLVLSGFIGDSARKAE